MRAEHSASGHMNYAKVDEQGRLSDKYPKKNEADAVTNVYAPQQFAQGQAAVASGQALCTGGAGSVGTAAGKIDEAAAGVARRRSCWCALRQVVR